MRLIDASELIQVLCVNMDSGEQFDKATHCVDVMPTVDAVPVIRCKDCKHYYALNEVRGNCSEYNFVEKIPIDFCSWAERMDGDRDEPAKRL